MLIIIAIAVFIVFALAFFLVPSLLDERRQAEMTLCVGRLLAICVVCGIVLGGVLVFAYQNASYRLLLGWVGLIFGFFLPYGLVSHRRSKRFEK
jgi:membrane associated rhomboid family serine protease